jgi:branched-chain amino acid transport system substrate-binding protein
MMKTQFNTILRPVRLIVAATVATMLLSSCGLAGSNPARTDNASGNIKVGILTTCEGAFGSFYEQTIAGALSAFAKYAGGTPVNASKPSAGMKGIEVAGKKIDIVGFGCSNDQPDTALRELRRLTEQLGADVVIGPLSGDEAIAVANYAKAHPDKTFINGTGASYDPTMVVRAPNYFRFESDSGQWQAGTGDLAFNTLGWKKVAIISDDYSTGYATVAGFTADYCGVGGNVTKRVFAPLNTTDYSSFVRQLPPPDQVDGYFWSVGGAGLIPALKAFEQAYGPLNPKQHMGNLYWGTPGQFEQLSTRVAGVYLSSAGTAGDMKTPAVTAYADSVAKTFKAIPPADGDVHSIAASPFVYYYYVAAEALVKALKSTNGDRGAAGAKLQTALASVVVSDAAYGPIKLDANHQAVQDQYIQQLYLDKSGALAIKTVRMVPQVDQTFGGTFTAGGPAPSRDFPACKVRDLPWSGKSIKIVDGVPQ